MFHRYAELYRKLEGIDTHGGILTVIIVTNILNFLGGFNMNDSKALKAKKKSLNLIFPNCRYLQICKLIKKCSQFSINQELCLLHRSDLSAYFLSHFV